MKRWIFLLALSGLLTAGQGHRFVCADYTQGKVFVVGESGEIEWSYDAETANDVWALPSGNLLFNTGHGVKEVTRDKRVVFSYESASEIYACQRLANGNTFIGECNAGRLLEVSPAGQIVKQVRLLPEGQDGGHAYMRNARRLDNGNYLVAHYGGGVVREYDPAGKAVWEVAAPGGPHSVVRLPDGNTLIASADAGGATARVFEVTSRGQDRLGSQWRRAAGHQPEVHGRLAAPAQRQHGDVQLAGSRPIRQGPAHHRGHAGRNRWSGRLPTTRPCEPSRAFSYWTCPTGRCCTSTTIA